MKRLLATVALASACHLACTGLASAQTVGQYLGEIRAFGFSFCPQGWLVAQGQTLPISQYTALYALYGTTYGGNGTSTFALPNLQGRAAIGATPQGQPIGTTYAKAAIANPPSNSQFGGLAITWCVSITGAFPQQ